MGCSSTSSTVDDKIEIGEEHEMEGLLSQTKREQMGGSEHSEDVQDKEDSNVG